MFDYLEIGRQLKEKRLSQNREVTDIIEKIKISESYLVAIEKGEIDDLPSPVYYHLFVRSYASELGLDPEKFLEEYETEDAVADNEQAGSTPVTVESKTKTLPENNSSTGKVIIFISLFVIIAFVVVLIFSMSAENGLQSEPENQPMQIQSETESETEAEVDEIATGIAEDIPADIPIADESVNEPVPELPGMTLDIVVSELSWILILADGDTVLHRNLPEGATRQLEAHDRFSLSIGNPNGVELKLNDTLMRPLSPTGRPVSNILITQANKGDFYQTIEDTIVSGN